MSLIGRRLSGLVAAWHVYEGHRDGLPVDLWLIDDHGTCTHLATGSDWCLVVEAAEPYASHGMGDLGRIDVQPEDVETPFARHVGDIVLAAREELEPLTGRMALELDFSSGRVRCESFGGDLHVVAVDRPEDPSTPMP